MQWTERSERFRSIPGGTNLIHPASVFDLISARIGSVGRSGAAAVRDAGYARWYENFLGSASS